jgi:hypothetical protein
MRSKHVWKERDEEGRKREVRATKFGGVWRLQAKYSDETEWTYYEDSPLLEDLRALKDIVERKYRRRRASAEDVAAVEKLIKEREIEL